MSVLRLIVYVGGMINLIRSQITVLLDTSRSLLILVYEWGALVALLELSFTFIFIFIFIRYIKNTANQQFYRYKSTHSKTNSKFKL